MQRCATYRGKRAELAWMLAGVVAAHVTLGIAVDQLWPSVRDPQYNASRRVLQERRTEAPGRPLVIALGSSRTRFGLRADQLSRGADPTGPLVFNFGRLGGGPMLQQIMLRRLLASGVHPDLVVVEGMTISLSLAGGHPIEESMDAAPLDAQETVRVLPYYRRPIRLVNRWCTVRLLPTDRHQAELRKFFWLDDTGATDPADDAVRVADDYGWCAMRSYDDAAAASRAVIQDYRGALTDPALARGPQRAFRDLLALCRQERIPAVLVLVPESSSWRTFSDSHQCPGADWFYRLAGEFDAPVYDARAWVGDDGFADGHHLIPKGAEQYTARFAQEVLAPEMNRLAARRRRLALGGAPDR